MLWFWVAIIAQIVLGTSAVFDKLLLRRGFFDPFIYTFWADVLGLSALVLVPFGFTLLPIKIVLLAFLTGGVFTLATFFFFLSIKKSEASTALPIIGGLAPIFTWMTSLILLTDGKLYGGELFGFFLLVAGGVFFLLAEEKNLRLYTFSLAALSALFFGVSNVLTKLIFEKGPFVTGFVWMRVGGFVLIMILLFWPQLRKRVAESLKKSGAKNQFLYFSNRAYAALGGILLPVAIFLAHPALVDATGSFKYIVIMLTAWALLKERFRGKALWIKLSGTLLIVFGLILIGLAGYAKGLPLNTTRNILWGVTFSEKAARDLGLDPNGALGSILEELKPRKIRLVAYWDEIARKEGRQDFSNLDSQLEIAKKYKTGAILAVGMKVPRWPECHIPEWAKNLKTEDRENALREYLKTAVSRYKNNSEIVMWQVENEPFLMFGECPKRGKRFLDKEIELVKLLDPSRPVLVTDGGELGLWYKAAEHGDVFGTTMYRKVYPRFIGKIFGIIEYPISPDYFRVKERFVKWLIGEPEKRFIVSELQAEPWTPIGLSKILYEEQIALFSPEYFEKTVEYAERAGFDEYYLWGAEWWYALKIKNNDDRIWQIAKELMAH